MISLSTKFIPQRGGLISPAISGRGIGEQPGGMWLLRLKKECAKVLLGRRFSGRTPEGFRRT
jgi:hypothetical protein